MVLVDDYTPVEFRPEKYSYLSDHSRIQNWYQLYGSFLQDCGDGI